MPRVEGTIHIHVKRDGSVFALGETPGGLRWRALTIDPLQSQLEQLRGKQVAVAYSRDDPESDPPKLVETIFKIIMSVGLPMQLLRNPPVPPQ
jgi:hypothetical protein